MKQYTNILLCFCAPMLMLLSGCLDEQVHTIVSSDGSSERVYSVQTSTRKLPTDAFPRPFDGTWSIEWKKPKDNESVYVYTARKKFATPEELSQEYSGTRDTGAIGISVLLKKRFEWFYTYLDYTETYTMRNRLVSVPVTEFLTDDEIERFIRGESSDSLNQKVNHWDSRNLLEAFFAELIAESGRRNDLDLTPALLNQKKEELFRKFITADSLNNATRKKGTDSTRNTFDNTKNVLNFCARILGTNVILDYESFVDSTIQEIFKKQNPGGHPDNWESSVQMPGLLLETNSTIVEGNSASWKFASKQIHVGHYLMIASSRVANLWVFITTGMLVVLIVGMGVWGTIKRRM